MLPSHFLQVLPFSLRLIDMVVCVFSVGRRPATLETYQSASSRPTRGGFSLLYRIYVEIFGGRKFRENFEAQNPHPEIFPKFSIRARKFLENFESPYKICDKVDFQSVGRRPGGPETQTNISINGGLTVA
jgi:hypothetical protein